MKMTKEEAIDYLICNDIFYESDIEDISAQFYINGLMEGEDIYDLDRYAWLNTLFGYDIGRDNARQIDSYLYNEMNFETLELCHADREMIENICNKLKLNVSFNKWATEEPNAYHYF